MIHRLISTGLIVPTWVLAWTVMAGLGSWALKPESCEDEDYGNGEFPFLSFWIGVAFSVIFLQVWHLAAPVSPITGVVWILLGSSGFLRHRVQFRASLGGWLEELGTGRLLILILALGWAGFWAAGPPTAYDSGMYDVPSVKWILNFPIVTGLGNLHGRLGFNNTTHLLAAMFEFGSRVRWSHHVLSGLFLGLLLCRIILSLLRRGGTAEEAHFRVFDVIVLGPILLCLHSPTFVSSIGSDAAAATALFFAARWMLAGTKFLKSGIGLKKRYLLGIVSALVLAPTFKLTAAAFSAAGLALFIFPPVISGRFRRPEVLKAGFLAMALLGIWAIRGIILTGYPAYPLQIGPLPVDWRVPPAQAQGELAWARIYGRWPDTLPSGSHSLKAVLQTPWVGPRINSIIHGPDRWILAYPAGLTFLLGTGLLALLGTEGARNLGRSGLLSTGGRLLLVSGFAIGSWWISAPNPDFGFAPMWIAAGATAALFAQVLKGKVGSEKLVLAALVLALVAIIPEAGANVLLGKPPLDLQGGPTGVPSALTGLFATDSGLLLWVPSEDNRCWAAPLPCTPHPAHNLELRDSGSIRRGFRTEGSWKPLRWPNPTVRLPLFEGPERDSSESGLTPVLVDRALPNSGLTPPPHPAPRVPPGRSFPGPPEGEARSVPTE